jgi:putative acyl-CoA dehydrogenase
MPRWQPDGAANGLRFQRLKDKLGNRSNASSEVEFVDALAWRVGEPGRGIPLILEMGNLTRLDSALSSAALMLECVRQAVHHASHREAFGRALIDQPLMRRVLVDLALEAEGAVVLSLALAALYDAGEHAEALALRRLLTPATKLWVCKRAPALAAEAMEVLGGNGYSEDFGLARIYRELPVNAIWEGSGNIMCLDARRAASRHPESVQALADLLTPAAQCDRRFAAATDALLARLVNAADSEEGEWRELTARIALLAQGALLMRHAPAAVADAWVATRLTGAGQNLAGCLPGGLDEASILERHLPAGASG